MDKRLKLWEIPTAKEIYMIAGWDQWADAGSISSRLPDYLIKKMEAQKIGEIISEDFYFFQIPGTHHFLRPQVTVEQGHRKAMTTPTNEFYYCDIGDKGLVIFTGEEPHLHANAYSQVFLDAVEILGVKRVVAVGGVYGAMPYDKDREVACVYSLPYMKEELTKYAVRYSDYEGGATIGTYLAHKAEARTIELLVFYAFVPAYDFSQLIPHIQGLRIENDFKAWYDIMRRIDFMFNLDINLDELEKEGSQIALSMESEIAELDGQVADINLDEYLEKLFSDFKERRFIPLGDMWERGLRDLFNDIETL